MDAVNVRPAPIDLRGQASPSVSQAPATDRFAFWTPLAARLGLLALVLLVILAALVPQQDPIGGEALVGNGATSEAVVRAEAADQDIALYDTVIRKIQAGQNYYDFIVPEHRARNYPVQPGLVVRLPTLAYFQAALGTLRLDIVIPVIVLGATIWAWWRRFGDEAGIGPLRRVATGLVFLGAALIVNPRYYSLHELWAGAFLFLSLGLHRVRDGAKAGRWKAALFFAGLALCIREHALPFVLLMGAMALYRRDWREAAAWGALVGVFLIVLSYHVSLIAPQVMASDRMGDSWWAFRGLSGWIGNIVQAGSLRVLPDGIAGPAVILTVLGWASLRTPLGVFGFFVAVGYGLMFMIVGRWNNFYWGALVAPMIMPGLAFAPRGLVSLWRSAGRQAQT